MLRCLSSPLFQKPYTEIKYTLYIVYIDTHLPVSSHAQHNHYYYLYTRDGIQDQDWDQGQSMTGNLAKMTSNLR